MVFQGEHVLSWVIIECLIYNTRRYNSRSLGSRIITNTIFEEIDPYCYYYFGGLYF